MINLGPTNEVEAKVVGSWATVSFQIQPNGSTVFSPTGFDCELCSHWLSRWSKKSSSVTSTPSLNHGTLGITFALRGTLMACCILSLHRNTVCSRNLKDKFFNNRRIWKEQKAFKSCSCKYSFTSFLYLWVPRKGDPELGSSYTPSCFYYKKSVFCESLLGHPNLQCVLIHLI